MQNVGSVRIRTLLDYFGSLSEAWNAPESAIRESGLQEQAIQAILTHRKTLKLEAEYAKIGQAQARMVTWIDPDYPQNLLKIHDAPPVLYIRGTLLPSDERALAMVGTRKASRYGTDVAYKMANRLAREDVTIISGLAQGIDGAAHQGALDGGGRTIAVLGCGIDKVYPTEHRNLANAIIENGALISEFPLGTPPTGTNFPRRNRIISGLSLGVLVVEAPENSGALITAESALEQGREVFAIPSNIFNANGAGCNKLIQDGAKLIMRPEDILDELNVSYDAHETKVQTEKLAPANETEKRILAYLESDPIHVDDITRDSGLSSAEVNATLTILELKGLAQSVGHMQYCRAR